MELKIYFHHTTSEYYPNEVYINEYKTNNVTYCYYLNETDNVIGLIWHDLINSCNCMFVDVLILQKLIYQILILQM